MVVEIGNGTEDFALPVLEIPGHRLEPIETVEQRERAGAGAEMRQVQLGGRVHTLSSLLTTYHHLLTRAARPDFGVLDNLSAGVTRHHETSSRHGQLANPLGLPGSHQVENGCRR